MSGPQTGRRRFLEQMAAAAMAGGSLGYGTAGILRAGESPPGQRAVRLGGPVFDAPQDPEGLALAHKQQGYRAAYCPGVRLGDKEKIRELAAAFTKHDVVIAEVGRWCNLLEADPQKRAENLRQVTEGLALADEVGARCCVDIAGSYSTEFWYGPHPDNLSRRFFEASVENARKIIDAVKPKRAKFCFEMMGWALPDGPDSYLALIKAVDRQAFGVHLDPCNLVNSPQRFYDTTALLNACFDKLGPWITSCHAKDVAWTVEMQVHFREVPVGKGVLDFATYLKRLAALPHDPPLMIEHMQNAQEYDQSRRYLFELGKKTGVAFS